MSRSVIELSYSGEYNDNIVLNQTDIFLVDNAIHSTTSIYYNNIHEFEYINQHKSKTKISELR